MYTTTISGKGTFSLGIMAGIAYVASSIPRFIPLEVVKALRATLRQRASVTVMRVETVVDMAEKAARAVKPRSSSNKHSPNKPIRPIIAVWSAVVWGIVEVPVRAHWRRPDIYADANLGFRRGRTA
jgi:hypothetical protein